MTYQIIQGNNIDVLKTFPDNYFDSVVTDPPYGISFLGKDWDSDTGSLETYQECLRVLKPGGYLLAFSAARTYHHLAITIERAGFEIRDQIMWIYSSGFPKSHDVGKKLNKQNIDNDYQGWGNALKPAHEPICMARKPCVGSIVNNVQQYGTGAINIDGCRIGDDIMPVGAHTQTSSLFDKNKKSAYAEETRIGRFPSNVIGEIEGYQKFFYCPKVNRNERHSGFDLSTIPTNPEGKYDRSEGMGNALDRLLTKKGNNHPTVKPVELMKYLIKLVTPKNGTVLDPYNGSGSTGMAAVELGYNYVGIELDDSYVEISKKRIDAHDKKHNINSELFVVE